jgi:DNA polymerase-1
MNRLLLVDGSNLLFQMFFGMPARITNTQGKAIQGTLGFVGALLKIIRMVQPTHVAVLFDGECANPRTALDNSYKANRADFSQVPEDESPFSQLPDIYAALDFMGIRHAETTDCEADDWMASYAHLSCPDTQVIISSQDSDLFQLIGPDVRILRYRGDKTVVCDADYIRRKFGILPEQYAAFKALTGDPSDNIRGADKIGPKTAAALLNQFADLEDLLVHADRIQKPSIRESVIRYAPRIRTNELLIRLSGNAPIPFPPDALTYSYNGITTAQVLSGTGLR